MALANPPPPQIGSSCHPDACLLLLSHACMRSWSPMVQIAADMARQQQQAELRRQQAEQRRQQRRRRGLQFDRARRERRQQQQAAAAAAVEGAGGAAEAEAGPSGEQAQQQAQQPAQQAQQQGAARGASPGSPAAAPSPAAAEPAGPSGSSDNGATGETSGAAAPAGPPPAADAGWDDLYASASSDEDEDEEDSAAAAAGAASSSGIDAQYAAALEAAAAGGATAEEAAAAPGAPSADALVAAQQADAAGAKAPPRQPSLWNAFEGGRRMLQVRPLLRQLCTLCWTCWCTSRHALVCWDLRLEASWHHLPKPSRPDQRCVVPSHPSSQRYAGHTSGPPASAPPCPTMGVHSRACCSPSLPSAALHRAVQPADRHQGGVLPGLQRRAGGGRLGRRPRVHLPHRHGGVHQARAGASLLCAAHLCCASPLGCAFQPGWWWYVTVSSGWV